MRVVYIGERIKHHAACSGYDQLRKFIRSRDLSAMPHRALSGILKTLPSPVIAPLLDTPPYAWYWRPQQLAREFQAMACLPFEGAVYHWLYGENDFRWAGRFPRHKNSRVVVSLHQPPEVFKSIFHSSKSLRMADAVIACASSQRDFLQDILGDRKVQLIPHGVDTNYFMPAPETTEHKSRFTVLMVGAWLRDFPLLAKVIKRAAKQNTGIGFNLVLPRDEARQFDRLPDTRVFSNLPDIDLLEQYQSANALFMPVHDFTASNALLEGMACGLPVVASDVGGVRDYCDSSGSLLIPPKNMDRALDALMALKENPDQCASMAKATRQKTLEFDWKKIAKTMKEVYKGLYA
ncbi:MAG: glycosyltransferase family 4 protein [Desulfatibacillum sp.]|nr:glycosyltransferase family 4 protein [Desulfatibacillum sp.]